MVACGSLIEGVPISCWVAVERYLSGEGGHGVAGVLNCEREDYVLAGVLYVGRT